MMIHFTNGSQHVSKAFVWTVCFLLVLSCCWVCVHSVVVKEDTKLVVEIPVFVDMPGFEKWKKDTGKTNWEDMRAEIREVMGKVNATFLEMRDYKPKRDMSIKLTQITLLDPKEFAFSKSVKTKHPFSGKPLSDPSKVLWGYQAISEIKEWMKKQPKDLALVFTGLEIVGAKITEGLPLYYINGNTYAVHDYYTVCGEYGYILFELDQLKKPDSISEMIGYTLSNGGRTLGVYGDQSTDPMSQRIHRSLQDQNFYGQVVLPDCLAEDTVPIVGK